MQSRASIVADAVVVTDALTAIRSAALALDRYHARHGAHGSLCPAALAVSPTNDVTILPPLPTSGATLDVDERTYWSPQRRAGEPPRTSDDLYALGVLALQLLQASHACESPADVTPSFGGWTSQLEPAVVSAVQALTSWSPSERPASSAELVRAIDAVTSDADHGTQTHTEPQRAAPQRAESASAAARRVARARQAHRLAQETPIRPVRPPRPRQIRAPLGKGHYPDMPLPTGWVAVLVMILCSVYLLPLYFMLFPTS